MMQDLPIRPRRNRKIAIAGRIDCGFAQDNPARTIR